MPPDRPRQLWLLPVLLITVIATAVGGLLARTWYEDPGPTTPAAVIPSSTTVPSSDQPGTREVQGTPDASQHPLYETVRGLLQRYFGAINERDYAAWQRAVTSERVERQPRERWLKDYRTTKDGSAVIYRIELDEDDDSARVLMTFTSTQAEEDAPAELPADCINWNVVFALVLEDDWKLDASPAGASPQHERCP